MHSNLKIIPKTNIQSGKKKKKKIYTILCSLVVVRNHIF